MAIPPQGHRRLSQGTQPVNDRRKPPTDAHALYVRWNAGLEVRCICGMVVGGNRYLDRDEISLSDLLELVRLHRKQVNYE